MRRLWPWLVLAGLARSAAADGGYGAIGIGRGADLGGSFADDFDSEDEVSIRLAAGARKGSGALELVFFGTDLSGVHGGEYSTNSVAVDLKLFAPIARGWEAYLRAGLGRTHLSGTGGGPSSRPEGAGESGPSWQYGVGVQWHDGTGGWYLDWIHEDIHLGDSAASVQMLTLGLQLGD